MFTHRQYGTRSVSNFQKDNIYFVEGKKGEQYAFVLLKEGEEVPLEIQLPWVMKNRDQHLIEMSTSESQSFQMIDGKMILKPSGKIRQLSSKMYAVVFRWM